MQFLWDSPDKQHLCPEPPHALPLVVDDVELVVELEVELLVDPDVEPLVDPLVEPEVVVPVDPEVEDVEPVVPVVPEVEDVDEVVDPEVEEVVDVDEVVVEGQQQKPFKPGLVTGCLFGFNPPHMPGLLLGSSQL